MAFSVYSTRMMEKEKYKLFVTFFFIHASPQLMMTYLHQVLQLGLFHDHYILPEKPHHLFIFNTNIIEVLKDKRKTYTSFFY